MHLPLAQKMSKILDRCISKQVRTEPVEGLGNNYGFGMARKESMEAWLIRGLYCMFCYDRPFQAQLGVMAFLEARSWHAFSGLSEDYLRMGHGAKWPDELEG